MLASNLLHVRQQTLCIAVRRRWDNAQGRIGRGARVVSRAATPDGSISLIDTFELTGQRKLVMRWFAYMLLIVVGQVLVGCGSRGQFPVASTRGSVTCEGQPVPGAFVFFEPLASGTSALVGKQGIGVADANGKFVISTYGDNDGAVIGKHRVRVGAPNADMHPNFSCPCTLNSEVDVLEVEVKDDGKNEFQLALKKKTGKEKLSLEELEAREEAKQAALEKARIH